MKYRRSMLNLKWNDCQGSVLTLVILMSVIISLLASSLSEFVHQESLIGAKDENRIKAFFLAEAGAAEAYGLLKEDFTQKDDPALFLQVNLRDGAYDVDILQTQGRVLIQSTGMVGSVSETIKMEIAFDNVYEVFDYGVFSNNDIDVIGSSLIDSDVHSNTAVNLQGITFINGTASTVGNVNIVPPSGAATIVEGVYRKTFPKFDFNTYYNLADPADRYTTNIVFDNVNLIPVNGIVYVDGDVTVSGVVNLTGALIATGTITVSGTLTQTGYLNHPALMSRDGDVVLNGSVQIGEGIIYAGGDDVEIQNTLIILGNVIAFDQVRVTGLGTVQQTQSSQIPLGLVLEESLDGLRMLTYHE